MIRRQDIAVLFFFYLGYSRLRNWILRLRRMPVARFVTFHDILSEDLSNFGINIAFLKQHTNVISMDDFFSGRLSFNKINVVISFDDGYRGWLTHAVPVLKEHGLPAIFFVSSGFIGLSKEQEANFALTNLFLTHEPHRITGCLSQGDIRRLVVEGFTIGGHTLKHTNLGKVRNRAQLGYEIAEDKSRLEKAAGAKVDYFSYPFGAFDNPEIELFEVLKESGYRGAVTTISGFNDSKTNKYLLHRELTEASMPGRVFRARIYGNYDAVRFIKGHVGTNDKDRQCGQAGAE